MEEELLSFVQQHKFLYDRNDPNYGNKATEKKAWEEIGQKLDIEPVTAKERWMYLKDLYAKRKKQTANEIKSSKLTHWKLEESMQFLENVDNSDNGSVDDLCMEDYLNFTPKTPQVSAKKKLTQDEMIKEPYKEISKLLKIAKSSFSESTSVGTFLQSLALQIENANLSFGNMCILQVDLLTAVHKAIRRQNDIS